MAACSGERGCLNCKAVEGALYTIPPAVEQYTLARIVPVNDWNPYGLPQQGVLTFVNERGTLVAFNVALVSLQKVDCELLKEKQNGTENSPRSR